MMSLPCWKYVCLSFTEAREGFQHPPLNVSFENWCWSSAVVVVVNLSEVVGRWGSRIIGWSGGGPRRCKPLRMTRLIDVQPAIAVVCLYRIQR